jgi:integrase
VRGRSSVHTAVLPKALRDRGSALIYPESAAVKNSVVDETHSLGGCAGRQGRGPASDSGHSVNLGRPPNVSYSLIRDSKFGKSRQVPFGPRLAAVLRAYLAGRPRDRGTDAGAPLFTWSGRQPVHTNSIRHTFRDDVVPRLDVVLPPGTRRPRVHDLRHSFAIGTLLRWYRTGLDPAARLHHLSTFLGHMSPDTTAVYLTITSDLFAEANRRFEALAVPIIAEVRP